MAIVTSLAERIDIVESSAAGEVAWRISQRLGWRQPTIRKWRNRGRKLGRAGLVSHMGRPAKGALSSFPEEISTTLLRWRQEHPGWGPITLHKELEQHAAFEEQSDGIGIIAFHKNIPAGRNVGKKRFHF